jgi:hypothetical protein
MSDSDYYKYPDSMIQCRLAEEYTHGSLLDGAMEQPLKGMFGLILPDNRIVPLDDPNDQVEIARKTATLGGDFHYFDKDFVDFKGIDKGSNEG